MQNMEKIKRNTKEKIRNAMLKIFLGKDTLYLMKHGGAVHFQQSFVINKKVRITTIGGEVFEGVVVDYLYPDWNKSEDDEIIVLDCPTRNDGYEYSTTVPFNMSNIKSAEILS